MRQSQGKDRGDQCDFGEHGVYVCVCVGLVKVLKSCWLYFMSCKERVSGVADRDAMRYESKIKSRGEGRVEKREVMHISPVYVLVFTLNTNQHNLA